MEKKQVTGIRLILGYLGVFLVFIGFLTTVPLLMLVWYKQESYVYLNFLIPATMDIAIGLIFYFAFIFKRKRGAFKRFEDSMLLILVWVFALLTGALPFYLAHIRQGMAMDFSMSFFESASAYSTTGLTVFSDYTDTLSSFGAHVYSFHRGFMQFVGGAGLVLLLASILGGQGNMSLFNSEGHSDRLLPSLGRTAKLILGIYLFYCTLCSLCLWICGLDWFDAVVTSMSVVSGGGMSPKSTNIYFYNSYNGYSNLNGVFKVNFVAVQYVVMSFAYFSAISFVLHTVILSGRIKLFLKDSETKLMIFNLFFFGLLILGSSFLFISKSNNLPFFNESNKEIAQNSLFYYVNAATNSGFASTSLDSMIELGRPALMVLTFVMLIGGGAGSTAGGIKLYRIVVCLKYLITSLHYKFAPTRQLYPCNIYRYGNHKEIEKEDIREAFNYVLLFIMLFLIASMILVFLPEIDLQSSMFTVASSISNTGLGYTYVSGAHADIVTYVNTYYVEGKVMLWTLSIVMLLGRLEIMPLFYAFRNIGAEVIHAKTLKRRNSLKNEAKAA